MILTDPPYCSGGTTARDRQATTSAKYTAREYNGAHRFPDFDGDNMDQRAFTAFMRDVLFRCRQLAKPGGVAAAFIDWRNLPALTDALQMAGWIYKGVVVWDKGTSRNQPGRFRADCEYIVWGSNGKMPVNWEPGQPALPGCYRIPLGCHPDGKITRLKSRWSCWKSSWQFARAEARSWIRLWTLGAWE